MMCSDNAGFVRLKVPHLLRWRSAVLSVGRGQKREQGQVICCGQVTDLPLQNP